MTKQERNDLILQALQVELQEKPYAKDKLTDKFEEFVQGLVAQGNQLLAGQPGEQQGAATQASPAAEASSGESQEEASQLAAEENGGETV